MRQSDAHSWVEIYYRIRRIPAFVVWFRGVSDQFNRFVIAEEKITHHSPPAFSFNYDGKEGIYYTLPEAKTTDRGKPCWYFNSDNSVPLSRDNGDLVIDPGLFKAAFETKIAEEMHKTGEEPKEDHSRRTWAIVSLLLFLAIALGGIAAYYSYNVCYAVHAVTCR